MLNMIVFALTLVIAQCVGGYILMKIVMKQFMSKKFIKDYSKQIMEVTSEIAEEMENYF